MPQANLSIIIITHSLQNFRVAYTWLSFYGGINMIYIPVGTFAYIYRTLAKIDYSDGKKVVVLH